MVCLILGVREKVGNGFEKKTKLKTQKKAFEWSLLLIISSTVQFQFQVLEITVSITVRRFYELFHAHFKGYICLVLGLVDRISQFYCRQAHHAL